MNEKAPARKKLREIAKNGYHNARIRIAIRINPLSTPDGAHDIQELIGWPNWPPLLILPKVESAENIGQLLETLPDQATDSEFLVMIESPAGIERAYEILSCSTKIAAVGFGSLDYAAATGCDIDFDSLLYARSRIVNAAAACGLPAIDGVHLDLRNKEGLEREARSAKKLGIAGKFAIHPNQIDTINEAFSYTSEEVAKARALLDAASRSGVGAFEFEGKMVDAPVIRRAEIIVASSLDE